jgi:hypothetical protein
MVNCPKCGTPLKEEDKFCIACGAKIEAKATPTQPPVTQQAPQQPAPVYVPSPAKKSKTGLIVGIVAIVVTIVVVIVVVFFVFGGGLSSVSESSFIGAWDVEDMMGYMTYEWTFYSNGSMSILYDWEDWGDWGDTSLTWATWHIENNKFYMGSSSGDDIPFDIGMDVEIKDSGDTIELKYTVQSQTITAYTLTKK